MRFHVLLPAVMGLLQGQRRVTYRILTYLFGLDEVVPLYVAPPIGIIESPFEDCGGVL